MKIKALLAAVAFAGMTSAVSAADIPTGPAIVVAPPPPAATFSWTGPYVGVYGGGMFSNAIFAGVNAGFAYQFGPIVAGIEGQIGTAIGGPPLHWSIWGRLGPAIGERGWLYGILGTSNYGSREFGGGFAYAITDQISIHTDVTVYCCWSPVMIRGGLNFHLGN